MTFKIWHHTRYTYSKEVFLEPHYLRFKPLQKNYLTLNHFHLNVDPEPAGFSWGSDAENNPFTQIWFNNQTGYLDIEAEIEVSVCEGFNLFSFIFDPLKKLKPGESVYSPKTEYFLKPYFQTKLTKEIKSYVDQIIQVNDGDIIASLTSLLEQIYVEWDHQLVEEPTEPDAENCFNEKKGSCRDLSWMLISMLRYAGLASRYVSGYTHNDELEDGHELHAWVETYLPGPGWIGLDPSTGLFTHEYYIPVSTSYDPANTMPVTGSFRGNAGSKIETHVSIERLDR